MSCNLPNTKVEAAIARLGREFSTLDYIAVCPSSGGTRAGNGCAIVRSEGRTCCGSRLAELARENPAHLKQTKQGSLSAHWLDRSKPTSKP